MAGIQLALAPADLQPKRVWRVDAPTELHRLQTLIENLTDSEIHSILEKFVTVTAEAQRVGFDVIQIHAAHGYVLSLLTNADTNGRSGQFRVDGPWLDGFSRRIRDAAASALVSFRINAIFGLRDRVEEENAALDLASRLVHNGIDMIDVSAGVYTIDRRLIYPAARDVLPNLAMARRIAEQLDVPVVFAGGIHDLRTLPTDLPSNVFVGLGRALIADPQFAEKAEHRQYDAINWCARTNQCHYFSRGTNGIACGVNNRI